MPGPSQIILLIEDSLHRQFIHRYLQRVGIARHALRFVESPSGAGSAEHWVTKQFPVEVKACQIRQAATKLIVLIDADILTVQQRTQQLDQALTEAAIQTVDRDEAKIGRLIPRRNIETWILALIEKSVNEEIDYKKTRNDWSSLVRDATGVLYTWTRPNAPIPRACVNSLRLGVVELRKLGL